MTKSIKKVSLSLLSLVTIATLAGCQKNDNSSSQGGSSLQPATETYEEHIKGLTDQAVYDATMVGLGAALQAANNEVDQDLRFAKFAKAEAILLDSAVMIPTTTRGGYKALTHAAPHTVPYVDCGNDDYRVKGAVITNELIKAEDIAVLRQQWATARSGGAAYNPKSYLEGKRYTFNTTYNTTWSTPVKTMDPLATSKANDSEASINLFDGLVQYDNLGNLKAAIAEENFGENGQIWKLSADKKTYTFKVRSGVKWVNSDGTEYGDVTAEDFATGFQHMLDTKCGLGDLVDGVIEGVTEYLAGTAEFSEVGVKFNAAENTISYTLVKPETFFPSRLCYTMFSPLKKAYFESKGGALGLDEWKEASTDCTYGKTGVNDILSCGPFRITQNTQSESSGEIDFVANAAYYDKDNQNIQNIKFVFDDGNNPTALFNHVTKTHDYIGCNLLESNGTMKMATDANLQAYIYTSDTDATTYFGALNLKRQSFAGANGDAKSIKSEAQKIAYHDAVQNKSFRKAILYAFNRTTWNGNSRGAELAETNLRNMYTKPDFVKMSAAGNFDGVSWEANETYGSVVSKYLQKLDTTMSDLTDGHDEWNQPQAAKKFLAKAKTELGAKWSGPVHIEVVAAGPVASNVSQAQVLKQNIEDTLGKENVIVDVLTAQKTDSYYSLGYQAEDGAHNGNDLFAGAGWGPDFADPSTYVNTYLPDGAGYMTMLNGLW